MLRAAGIERRVFALPWPGRRVVWGAMVVLVAACACAPPLFSHDVYSYIDYARLGALHGINPYLRGPAAAPGDPAFREVTWPHTPSAYGPLFTLLSYPLAAIPVGVALYTLKALSAGAVLGTALIVGRLARRRDCDPVLATAFVGLNPLVLLQVVGGAHNDGFAALVLMLGVAGALTGREARGGAAMVAACALKASAAFVVPFAVIGTAKRRELLAGALVAALAVALVANLEFGWSWLHEFALVGHDQAMTSHFSVPSTLARILGVGGATVATAALALYAVLIAFLLYWTHRGGDWIRAAGWAGTGLLLSTSWLLPWYLVLPLPLVALSRDRNLQVLFLGLTAFQLLWRTPI